MGVTIPCGRSWWKPGDIAGHCVAGHLCPNCTALRGLTVACEPFAILNSRVDLSKWDDDSSVDLITPNTRTTGASHHLTVGDIVKLRAALTAARPAGGHTEEKT